jgi:hypothetical protein
MEMLFVGQEFNIFFNVSELEASKRYSASVAVRILNNVSKEF